MSATKQLQAAGYSIASNIFVQVLSRSLTFILGAITLKYLQSSSLLGIINVRNALLYTTLQFLSREPFRRACLGELARSDSKNLQKILNTIWLGFPLSVILALPLSYVWRLNAPALEDLAGTTSADYDTSILLICLSVMIEMLSEPCFIYAQAKAIPNHNPEVEVTFVMIRCILTATVTVLESARYQVGQSSNILTKIAICQVIASLVSVCYSYARIRERSRTTLSKFLPALQHQKKSDDDVNFIYRNFDRSSLKLSWSFFSQTILKQLLTESERYVMTFFNVISLSDQGIYDVVNNLGSLAARLVFKPIEDSGYTLFSQTVCRSESLDIRKFYRVQENLMFMIKSMLLLSMIILTFGYNFVPLIVIYGGQKLNSALAFNLMRWQLIYTPLLAVNGITECFTFAIMDSSEIRQYNICMIFFSVEFLVTIYLSQSMLGSASFILANCMMMLSRILFSYRLIGRYFERHGYQLKMSEVLPSLTTTISMSSVFIFLSISQHYLLDLAQPMLVACGIVLGGYCLLYVVHVIICHEVALINFISRLFKLKSFL